MAGYFKVAMATLSVVLGVGAALLTFPGLQKSTAQEPPAFGANKVIHLLTVDLSGVADRQVIANIYEVPAGATVPRHWHHGDEFHLVLSGAWAAEVQDRPTHVMQAGDSQYVEREQWHGGKVVSQIPLKLLGVMIVEKDKPIVELTK